MPLVDQDLGSERLSPSDIVSGHWKVEKLVLPLERMLAVL